VTHLLKLTCRGIVFLGLFGLRMNQDEEAGGPHPGPPVPPSTPHGGRKPNGWPGGPVGTRRGEEEKQEEERRRERRQGGTA